MALLPALVAALVIGEAPSAQARATVWVRAGDRATGTGWVVDTDRRWAVTAGHVVGDADTVEVDFLDCPLNHPLADRRHYVADRADLRRRGLVATGRVLVRHANADLVLLALDHLPPGVPGLPLADTSARAADAGTSVGHRHDAERMWNLTAGRVRQVGRLSDGYYSAGRKIGAGVPLVLLQSPIEAGESGSAVVNDAGRVIGTVSAVVNQTPGLAVAIDVGEIRSLLADARGDRNAPAADPPPSPRADVWTLERATVWVRPQSTGGRAAGVLIDRDRKLVLTSATAVGADPVVDVVAPQWDEGRLLPEADAYADRLGLRLSGLCVAGMVLARDPARDLALVELDSLPPDLVAVRLSADGPRTGDHVASMGHPTGIDLLWLYAAGTVRSAGMVGLAGPSAGERPKVRASLLQLPHQGSASGGPVVNGAGDLVGILAAREAARQELAYAATPDEVRAFLDAAAPLWRPRAAGEWARRGRLAMKLRRPGPGRDAFRVAAALSPDDGSVLAGYASLLAACGEEVEALRVAESAAARKPGAAALAELADVLLRLGQTRRASELVEQALRADGRCAGALVVRARLRPGPLAVADIADALLVDPGFAAAYRARAGQRDQTNDGRRAALSDWGRVLELDPMDLDGLRERAQAYAAVKEPKKAAADWARLAELEPLRAGNWAGLARARLAAGDRAGAADALRSAARVDPAHARAAFGVVRELATELERDDPADRDRVAAWRSVALSQLADWLPR